MRTRSVSGKGFAALGLGLGAVLGCLLGSGCLKLDPPYACEAEAGKFCAPGSPCVARICLFAEAVGPWATGKLPRHAVAVDAEGRIYLAVIEEASGASSLRILVREKGRWRPVVGSRTVAALPLPAGASRSAAALRADSDGTIHLAWASGTAGLSYLRAQTPSELAEGALHPEPLLSGVPEEEALEVAFLPSEAFPVAAVFGGALRTVYFAKGDAMPQSLSTTITEDITLAATVRDTYWIAGRTASGGCAAQRLGDLAPVDLPLDRCSGDAPVLTSDDGEFLALVPNSEDSELELRVYGSGNFDPREKYATNVGLRSPAVAWADQRYLLWVDKLGVEIDPPFDLDSPSAVVSLPGERTPADHLSVATTTHLPVPEGAPGGARRLVIAVAGPDGALYLVH